MKFPPEDPRLTAYVLGEASPEDAAAIEEAATADPAVRMALEEIVFVQRQLKAALPADRPTLLPEQRDSIVKEINKPAPAPLVPVKLPIRQIAMAAAVLLALGAITVLATRKSGNSHSASTSEKNTSRMTPTATSSGSAVTPTTPSPAPAVASGKNISAALSLLPFPGPTIPPIPGDETVPQVASNARERDEALKNDPSAFLAQAEGYVSPDAVDLDSLPAVIARPSVSTANASQLPLPVLTGRSSLAWIDKRIRSQRTLPPTKAVRLEEILNSFDLRPGGTSAIAKGASLSAESLACPWKPSATLLMIHFQGAIDGPRAVEAALMVDPMAVSKFRLLGFYPVKGATEATLPTHLPAKTGTTLLVEIEPRASARALGEIHWKVDGSEATALPILRVPDAEPSNDARFAALLAAYSLWLTRDQPSIIDEGLVGGLARECAANDLPENRKAAMILIAKCLEIDP